MRRPISFFEVGTIFAKTHDRYQRHDGCHFNRVAKRQGDGLLCAPALAKTSTKSTRCYARWTCISSPRRRSHWAPGYYYVLFEDPDGIRLEVNHVPGQAVLAENTSFNPGNDW